MRIAYFGGYYGRCNKCAGDTMSDQTENGDVETIPYIPRLDDQGRVEIIFPTVCTVPVGVQGGPCCEVFGSIYTDGNFDEPTSRYTSHQGDYQVMIDQTEPIRPDDFAERPELDDKVDELLDIVRGVYAETGTDVEFVRYYKRTPDLHEQFMENARRI